MPWRAITSDEIKGKFHPAELAVMKQAQSGPDADAALELLTSGRLPDARKAFVGAMAAAGYPVPDPADDTIPDQLREHVMARAVWSWLTDFPKLANMMTDGRKEAAKDAAEALKEISKLEFGAIEAPTADADAPGNWNSEAKLIGRMHPVPSPALQVSGTGGYANSDGPTDS